jgi:hypothetical protein
VSEEIIFHREQSQPSPTGEADLFINVAQVGLDRVLGNKQLAGHLAVGASSHRKTNDVDPYLPHEPEHQP